MANFNNNQIFDGTEENDEWPNDVFGFLRGERSSGLNLWVTFVEDKVELKEETKNHCNYPKSFDHIEVFEEEKELYDEDYSPYVRLFADENWEIYDGMPEAWKI
ncbi:uncharacterized protein [Argopecten irradians]|uniref:uncharacterized protein n=1 Tax=Argopecten irradians TaxID=31199 RepID=UPI003719E5B1